MHFFPNLTTHQKLAPMINSFPSISPARFFLNLLQVSKCNCNQIEQNKDPDHCGWSISTTGTYTPDIVGVYLYSTLAFHHHSLVKRVSMWNLLQALSGTILGQQKD